MNLLLRYIPGLLAALFLCMSSCAQSPQDIRDIILQYDHDAVTAVFNQVAIGLEVHFENGKIRTTPGLLRGHYHWKNFSVSTPQGTFNDGMITFSRPLVLQAHDSITVTVEIPGRQDWRRIFKIPVSLVTQIEFNLYADSLKRGIAFDLNVQGRFNTGKVYPLDTADVLFKNNAGRLMGNNLWVDPADTTIHFIQVTAIYKLDTQLTDKTIIPVKQLPDTASLPTEESVLRHYQQKRSRR